MSHADWDTRTNLSYTVYHVHVLVIRYFVEFTVVELVQIIIKVRIGVVSGIAISGY